MWTYWTTKCRSQCLHSRSAFRNAGPPVHAAAGGVGLLLTQMAKMRGANVIATVSTEEKAELARSAGADEIILEDIVASLYDRPFDPGHINTVARSAYLPLSFSGRIQSVEDAMVALRAGADNAR